METELVTGVGLRIACDRDDLVSRLAVVSRALSSRGTVQVLGGVSLRGASGQLELAATDMEVSLRTAMPATVEGGGTLVIPGKLVSDLVRLLPAAEVVIEHRPDEGVAHITSGTYASRVSIFAAEDFPRLPAADGPLHAVSREALVETIERVSKAASRDESRPVLTGILVRFEGATLTMAATDSYRLAVKETALDEAAPDLEAIIPARALVELSRLAAQADVVQLGVQENHVVFVADDVTLTSRRIDGQFPDHRQLIPETFDVELELPRGEFLDVVRRASVMAQRNAPLRLRFAEGELTVSAQSQDVGEGHESLPTAYQGEPLEIGFNAEFLRDGLESMSTDEIVLKLINPLRPGLLSAPGDTFLYLIMPIRLAG